MKVVVLAGNTSTKLLPLSEQRPKALLPIANEPLAFHLVKLLKRSGFKDIIFCLSEDSKQVMNELGTGAEWGVNLSYSVEHQPCGTAGALAPLHDTLKGEPFVVMGCNVLFDGDLRKFVNHHRKSGAAASIMVSSVSPDEAAANHESVEFADDGTIKQITRDNGAVQNDSLFPVGIYCFQPEIFEAFKQGESFLDIKEQLIPRLAAAGKKIASYELSGAWHYLYTIDDYVRLNEEVLEGRLSTFAAHEPMAPDVWLGENVKLGRNVNFIAPVVIGDNTVIEDDVQLVGPLSIGSNCTIGKKSIIRDSVVWDDCKIAAHCQISNSVMASKSQLGQWRAVRDTVIVERQLQPATANLLSRKFHITTIAASKPAALPTLHKRQLFAAAKRGFDIVFSLLLLLLLLPVIAVVALAIKLDSRGPVFFRQRRCGLYGKEFLMFKFRSMVQDADKKQGQLQHLNQADGPVFKIENDPRMTRVGRFIRKLSLDEIPQLLNIVTGDMSFVGPRPLAMRELRLSPSWSELRMQVKPGLTGLWQVSGRSSSGFNGWVEMDTFYARHQSLALDFKILAKTPMNVLMGSGAC